MDISVEDERDPEKMRQILARMTPGEEDRFEHYRRSRFNRAGISQIMRRSLADDARVDENSAVVVAALAKMFVGDLAMSSWLSCVGTECLNCNLTDDPDEMDPFDSLRLYARVHTGAAKRVHLGAPDLDDGDDVPTGNVRNLTDDEFKSVFKHTIERRGWPVLKYGKGKALKRCLKVEGAGDDAHLSWGSKKEGAATKQVKVAEIHDVVNAAFDDAPPNMDPACMLCFNISNRAGLKIIAHSKTDATVLIHGFKLLTEPKNADIDQIRAKAIMV
ncbi:hypothetical protein JL722_10890 [Aureococcus anophagefferens]|nr:hypothetical protein JL722_10890 [Aureococcus anophagefferens]